MNKVKVRTRDYIRKTKGRQMSPCSRLRGTTFDKAMIFGVQLYTTRYISFLLRLGPVLPVSLTLVVLQSVHARNRS